MKIKVYSVEELAMLYRPDVSPTTAKKSLRQWLEMDDLKQRLEGYGYHRGQKLFTPNQVREIVTFIGEPE